MLVTVPKGVAAKLKPVLERKDPLVAPLAENGVDPGPHLIGLIEAGAISQII